MLGSLEAVVGWVLLRASGKHDDSPLLTATMKSIRSPKSGDHAVLLDRLKEGGECGRHRRR